MAISLAANILNGTIIILVNMKVLKLFDRKAWTAVLFIDVDDNVLKNLRLISRYFELNGERNITASIAIDLQSMIEDNHVVFIRDELSYMLSNVCTT